MSLSATDNRKPPYGGFGTFWNFIQQLHEQLPLPQRLDRAVMGSKGGSTRSELYTALRFFGLIDDEKAPTARLHALTQKPDKEELRKLWEEAYASVIALDLTTATPRQVDEQLEALGSSASTTARSRTFFLNGADDAGIEIGHTLKTARAPTSGPRRPRRKAAPKAAPKVDEEPKSKRPKVIEGLIDGLPAKGEDWSAEDAEQWLSLARAAFEYAYGFKYPPEPMR